MKLIKFLIIGMFFFLFSGNAFGQDLTYSVAEGLFNDSQKEVLKKADTYLKKGDKKIASAEKIESKYQKYLDKKNKTKKAKKKKKYQKKFDKKTAEARKIRVHAEKDYLKAYQDAIAVYSQLIVAAKYFDEGDKTKALSLNSKAETMIVEAENKMVKYNKIVSNKKKLKSAKASYINSAISEARKIKEEALVKQKQAIDIVLIQGKKKELYDKDENAWKNAKSIHSIASYQDYIDNFPTGMHVTSARSNIRLLESEVEKTVQSSNTVNSDYIFKVQIASSVTPLPQNELASKYSNTDEIQQVKVGYRYKYWVGNFGTYQQAVVLRDQLLVSSVYDAFIVVFDKDGNQIDVSYDMKN